MGEQDKEDNWHDWFQEWGDRFLLFARQQTGTFSEAEDVVQEAFVRIWSNRDQFPVLEAGLFFTQIRRLAIDHARRDKRRHRREESFASDNEPCLFDSFGDDSPDILQDALRQIPPEQREVLVLKVWGDQSFESIGRTLDISANTAASRYRYGLERMRGLLKEGME